MKVPNKKTSLLSSKWYTLFQWYANRNIDGDLELLSEVVAPNHPIGSEGHLVLMHDQDTYGKFALQFQREINVIKDESWLYRFPLCNVIIQDMLPSFVFGV